MSHDFTHRLQQLMQPVGVSSFRELSRISGVSEKQIIRLRRDGITQMRVEMLLKLSQALQIPVTDLLTSFSSDSVESEPQPSESSTTAIESPTQSYGQELADLKQEYDRLQATLADQKQILWYEFQQASLQVLESLLLQLPTAAYAAQQNPQSPAVKLLPLLRPLDQLLQEWGIEAIVPVGSAVPYNPQEHQLMEGAAQVGDPVRVRYTGYRQGDKLLYRAKVSPAPPV